MSTNPFSIDVVVSGQGRKLFEQLDGLTSQEAQELLAGGYFTALREAKKERRLSSPASFRSFLSGDCKLVRTNLVLDCTKPFDPVALTAGFLKELERDERAYALTSVDFSKCQFLTGLIEGEDYVIGKDKLRRLQSFHLQFVRHGGNQWLALWEDHQKNGDNSVLEHLRLSQGITHLDFPGLILQDPGGGRSVLCLYWDDADWHWYGNSLSDKWDARSRSSVSPIS